MEEVEVLLLRGAGLRVSLDQGDTADVLRMKAAEGLGLPAQQLVLVCGTRLLEGSEAVLPLGRTFAAVVRGKEASKAVTGGTDGVLRYWDLDEGTLLTTLEGHSERQRCTCISLAGSKVLTGYDDGLLKLWDLQSGCCGRMLRGHQSSVQCLSADWVSMRAISSSGDGSVRLWDLVGGRCLGTFPEGPHGYAASLVPDFASMRAVSGSCEGIVRYGHLWAAWLRELPGHQGKVLCLGADWATSEALSGSQDCTLRHWDLKESTCLRTLVGHGSPVECLAVDFASRRALSGAEDGEVRRWDLLAGECSLVFAAHTSCVNSISVDFTSLRAVTASRDGRLKCWGLEAENGECKAELEAQGQVLCASVCF